MKINREGCYRIVFMLKKIVIKVPNFLSGWMFFIFGINANLREYLHNRDNTNPFLCPIFFRDFLGFCIIMPRCEELTDEEFMTLDYKTFQENGVFAEYKANSFGHLNGKIVCFDYDKSGW